MLGPLPGDRYTEEDCISIAEKFECPASNICRYCGEEIKVMAYSMTGSCSVNHEKLRYKPEVFDHLPVESQNLNGKLQPRDGENDPS